ncbi:hypothetical protein HN51_024371, partial [Arachis hypogaea]
MLDALKAEKASWNSIGILLWVWDLSSHLNALAESETEGRLVFGLLAAATWNIDNTPFVGHTASVEDLQWSPTEPYVFASCSVDGSIAIWDTRWGKLPAASFKDHNADVNVMSWNRLAS